MKDFAIIRLDSVKVIQLGTFSELKNAVEDFYRMGVLIVVLRFNHQLKSYAVVPQGTPKVEPETRTSAPSSTSSPFEDLFKDFFQKL